MANFMFFVFVMFSAFVAVKVLMYLFGKKVYSEKGGKKN